MYLNIRPSHLGAYPVVQVDLDDYWHILLNVRTTVSVVQVHG
jgi:hypothetical protein